MDTAEFRIEVVGWLDEHLAELTPPYVGVGTLDEQMVQLSRVKRALFDAGWIRWGWPESVGGLGGPSILRAVLGEEVTGALSRGAGLLLDDRVLAPTLAEFAAPSWRARRPELSAARDGCEDSPSRYRERPSSLPAGATPSDGHWVINGQKLWTSLSQHASRCVLLTRTGPPGSRHRGITASSSTWTRPGSRCDRSRS